MVALHDQIEDLRDLADRVESALDGLAERAGECGELELRDDLRLSQSTAVEDLRALAGRCEEVVVEAHG